MLQRRPAQELSFGPRALKDALLSRDVALQRLYATTFSPAERLFLAEAYSPRRMLFGTPLVCSAFDWPLSRPEAPEDFETFHAALGQRRPGLARRHIYLQPIGKDGQHGEGTVRAGTLQACTALCAHRPGSRGRGTDFSALQAALAHADPVVSCMLCSSGPLALTSWPPLTARVRVWADLGPACLTSWGVAAPTLPQVSWPMSVQWSRVDTPLPLLLAAPAGHLPPGDARLPSLPCSAPRSERGPGALPPAG